MGSKGGEDSQWGWWGWQVAKVGWGWRLSAVQLQRQRVGEASTWAVWCNCDLYSNFLTNTNSMYQLSPFFFCFFLLPIPFMSDGATPHVLLMVVNYSSRCLNNKSQITCVCKMVINNASVPRNHRWILTYHLRQFPENVALLLPMGSRSVQVFYNLCRKKIKRVCQCPESEGSRLRDSKW